MIFFRNFRAFSVLILASFHWLLFFSCTSTNIAEKPLWASEDTLESVYPRSKYIARLARGDSAKGAAALAEAELTSHFSHSVSVTTIASDSKSLKNGSIEQKQSINREVTIRAAMELFAVRKTESWYDKNARKYAVCAYIDREEAWAAYRPRVVARSQEFHSYYDKAFRENDAFKKIKLLHACEESAQNLSDELDFVRLLSPEGFTEFADDRAKIAGLKEELTAAKISASMKISVKNDDGNKILRLITSLLSGEGYYLSERDFAYIVNADVEKNLNFHKDGGDTIVTSEPGLSITVTNGSEKLFSYNKSFQRISGFSETFVDKKLYSALEQEINESFIKEFKAALE